MFGLDSIVGLFAPFDCVICGHEGELVCRECLPDAFLPIPSRYYRCHTVSPDSRVCKTCKAHSLLGHVWVATTYKGTAQDVLWQYKFERAISVANVIAAVIDDYLPHLPPNTIISHIPTATIRVRQRGYDHSRLVAQALAKRRGLAYVSTLARMGQSRQVGATRADRHRQLEAAFRPLNTARAHNRPVLLIDDVVTTGATIEAAAKALKQANPLSINAALFAQKQ